jgi:excisionase family DNA binding protein
MNEKDSALDSSRAHESIDEGPLFFTTEEIAKRYRVSVRKVLYMVDDGKLPAIKFGGRCFRFNVKDCDRALRKLQKDGGV